MPGTRKRGIAGRVALAATAMTLLAAGSAQANTATVGSTLTATFAPTALAADTTIANSVLPAPAVLASPSDGTVISWRYHGSDGPFSLRILRSTGGGSYTGAGTSASQTSPTFGAKGPFTTSLPIKRGDLVGLNGASGASYGSAATTGATTILFAPPLGDGATAAPTTTTPGAEAAVNATVRYCLVPTLKGQTGKAARRALAAADCKVGTVKKTKKRRPFKQVLGQSVKPGSSVSDTTLVNFKVSKKAKPRAKPRCKKGKKAGRKKCPRKKKPR